MRFDSEVIPMRKIAIFLIAALPLLCSAEDKNTQEKAKKAPVASAKKTTPPAKAMTIPTDAVKTGDNTYSKTDAQGRTWIYSKTPFGVTKAEQTDSSQKGAAVISPPVEGLTAVEDGDSIKFERPSPFGKQSWSRKKSDLTDDERAVWERQKAASAKREQ